MGEPFVVELCTSDGVQSSLACEPEETILDAARAAGMVLPSLCGNGSCGSCMATVIDGPFEMNASDPAALGRDPAPGAALLCSTCARGDLRIALPYPAARIGDAPPTERQAVVVAVERVAPTTVRLQLQLAPDDSGVAVAEFEPGQFVQLQIAGRPELRAYSIANTANWEGTLEFFIRLQPGGVFSTYLDGAVSIGDELTVHGPQGALGLHENGLRERWFVAGGSGLAPMLSMLRRMSEWGDPQPARLYAGFTTEADRFAGPQIAELASGLAHFELHECLWDPSPGWTGRSGTPADALVSDLPTCREPPDIYACGPPAMIDAVTHAIDQSGVPRSQLFSERFTVNQV